MSEVVAGALVGVAFLVTLAAVMWRRVKPLLQFSIYAGLGLAFMLLSSGSSASGVFSYLHDAPPAVRSSA